MIKTDVSLGADRNEGREIGSMFSCMGSRMILFSCVETMLDCFLLCSFVDECEKVVLSFITAGFFIGKSHDFYNHISQGR